MIYPGMLPAQGPSAHKFFELPTNVIFHALAEKQKGYNAQIARLESLADMMDQLDIHEKYHPEYGKKVDEITQRINALSSGQYDLTSPEFQRQVNMLRRGVRREFGPDGTFGVMAQATKQYRDEATRLQEAYKDNPRWQQAYLSGLAPADIAVDPNTGLRALTPGQMLPGAKPFTQEDIQMGASRAIAALTKSTYAKELGIETVDDLVAVLNDSSVSKLTKERLQGMLREYMDANGELTQSRIIENLINLQNDPNYAGASMDELMAEAQAKAKIDVDDMITNIAGAAAWTQDERRTSVLDGDNLLGGGTGGGPPLPSTIQIGADDKKDDKLGRREAYDALGLLEITDDNKYTIPPSRGEYMAHAMRLLELYAHGYREIPKYQAGTGNIKADYVDAQTGKAYRFDQNAAQPFNDDLVSQNYDTWVAGYDKKYKKAREKYEAATKTLEENGFFFNSKEEAIEFLQNNYQDINRQWQVDLITPASITNSANSDAFSAALASLERNVPINMDIIVSDYSDYDSEKMTLRKYIQEQVAGNQTKTEAAQYIQLDNKELVSVRADGSLVFKIRFGNKKESELMFTVEPTNANLQRYTAPMRELTNIFYPADEDARRNVRTLLAAGESIPLSYRPGRIVAQFEENGQIVSEELIQPKAELVYYMDKRTGPSAEDPEESELCVQLSVDGKGLIYMPISEYMAQLRRNTTEYIASEGL